MASFVTAPTERSKEKKDRSFFSDEKETADEKARRLREREREREVKNDDKESLEISRIGSSLAMIVKVAQFFFQQQASKDLSKY